MRRVALIVAPLALAAACAAGVGGEGGTSSSGSSSAPASSSSGGPMTVAEAYGYHCASCHGDDGSGTIEGPQILNPVVGYASYVVRHGRDEMGYEDPMPEVLSDELSDALLIGILDWLREAPHPTDGEGLYVRFCGNCHGAGGVGGRADEDVAGAELDEIEETVREGHGENDYGDRKEYMPAWPAAELSNAEVAAIGAYLSGLPGGGDDD